MCVVVFVFVFWFVFLLDLSVLLPQSTSYFNGFYHYSGAGRPTDQETVAIEKIVTQSAQEEGALYSMEGHTGKHQGQPGGKGWGKCGQEPLLWFLQEGTGEAGKAGLRLA